MLDEIPEVDNLKKSDGSVKFDDKTRKQIKKLLKIS